MNDKVILLIEDNPDDEALTVAALRKYHVANEVIRARDGVEAMDYLLGAGAYAGRDISVLPAMVLLDLKLPKLDGHEVLKRIRSDDRLKRMPVVILTSSNEEHDPKKGYDGGANSYIRKPVAFEEFTDVVRQLGMYWLVLNEKPPR